MPEKIMSYAKAAGCAAKIGPGDLNDILKGLKVRKSPRLLVGFKDSDDAAIYKLTPETALVQTIDIFTPVVNDPYRFGQVAAANALSDVYAMGGKPVTALNFIAFPVGEADPAILRAIVEGGLDKINESGAVLCGGHSIRDTEIKFGFSVTGLVHPKKYWANAHARAGDKIILTKRIGTGIISTAIKSGLAGDKEEKMIAASMSFLNRRASEIASGFGIRACTDITGFGLFGHALEIAIASKVCIEIDTAAVPLFSGVRQFLAKGAYPGGGKSNLNYCACRLIKGGSATRETLNIMLDPQTSGGLLIFVQPDKSKALLDRLHRAGIGQAAKIGQVTASSPGKLIYY